MKDTLEIAPEIRGLLEEIASDPRSSLRFVPRRPLRSWFLSGETIRAGDVDGTRAEKHLITAHREALAKLLLDIAAIANLKRDPFVHVPLDSKARPLTPRRMQDAVAYQFQGHKCGMARTWRFLLGATGSLASGRDLLAVSQAALMLAPRDSARYYCAAFSPQEACVSCMRDLAEATLDEEMRARALALVGGRLSLGDDLGAARDAYLSAGMSLSALPIYVLTLSCYLGDLSAAGSAATQVSKRSTLQDHDVKEALRILPKWAETRGERARGIARRTAALLRQESEVVTALGAAL